jgi:hypothetical protein
MTLNDLSRNDAIRLVEWFDSTAFRDIVAPLIMGEQDMLLRQLLLSKDAETDARLKGKIEALTDVVSWRETAYEISTQKNA